MHVKQVTSPRFANDAVRRVSLLDNTRQAAVRLGVHVLIAGAEFKHEGYYIFECGVIIFIGPVGGAPIGWGFYWEK